MITNVKFPNENHPEKGIELFEIRQEFCNIFFWKRKLSMCTGKGSVCFQIRTRIRRKSGNAVAVTGTQSSVTHHKQTNKHNSMSLPRLSTYRRISGEKCARDRYDLVA